MERYEDGGSEYSRPGGIGDHYDEVTGLPQPPILLRQIERASRECMGRGRPLSIVTLAYDAVYNAPELYGYDGGETLRAIARAIRTLLRSEQFLARSGQVFSIVLPEYDETRAAALARLLVDGAGTLEIGRRCAGLTAVAGIATLSEHEGRSTKGGIRASSIALHHARHQGRGSVVLYTPELGRMVTREAEIERGLKTAIRNGDLYLLYQPIVEIGTGAVVGVEALARWLHPELGVISPGEFVPVAERIGIAGDLDLWVLERAIEDIASSRLDIHVNVSAANLGRVAAGVDLRECVLESGIEPRRLTLELTESAPVDRHAILRDNLLMLRASGMRLAIDDIGTGFNSLEHFALLPVDLIKIERSFIDGPEPERREKIVRALTAAAAALGVEVVAEGIERREQAVAAQLAGARYVQGFLFGFPMRADRIVEHRSDAAS